MIRASVKRVAERFKDSDPSLYCKLMAGRMTLAQAMEIMLARLRRERERQEADAIATVD
jgi:hypothetical protein